MRDLVSLLRQRNPARFCRDCGEPECLCYREDLREDSERQLRVGLRRETQQAFSEASTASFLAATLPKRRR
jgi:hypothetical protein